MNVLEELYKYKGSNNIAMVCNDNSITYKELWEESDKLASYIKVNCEDDHTPIVVYGHKNPRMLVGFLGCVKSGHAYVPVDITVPRSRVESIIDTVKPPFILTTESLDSYQEYKIINILEDKAIQSTDPCINQDDYVKDDSVYYIIFTSGSSGVPKGVQITYSDLNHFVEWGVTLGRNEKLNKTFMNQAPFSFDLSVMDLYLSLVTESCLYSLEKSVQSNYKVLFDKLKNSGINVWVSTPSFADVCLADASFNQDLMPGLELFLFCGETLSNKTAESLLSRFPKAQVYNTYGPTESTVAVTEVDVTEEVLQKYSVLPVGKAKPGTEIIIMDGNEEMPEGEKGEIVIIGNTVSAGYINDEHGNQTKFFTYDINGVNQPAYRTGDKGYYKDGYLFYCGRIDLQIKLHGYRMELEDVESSLMKVEHVEKAVVIPVYENDVVKYIKAFCIYSGEMESDFKTQKVIKNKMKEFVPDYMIPRKIQFVKEIPMNVNGKADRKKLMEIEK